MQPLSGHFLAAHLPQGVPAVPLVVELGLYDVTYDVGGFREEGRGAPVAWQLETFRVGVCLIDKFVKKLNNRNFECFYFNSLCLVTFLLFHFK